MAIVLGVTKGNDDWQSTEKKRVVQLLMHIQILERLLGGVNQPIYVVLKLVEVTVISRGFMLVLYYVAQTMNGTMKMLKYDYVY